MGSAVPRQLPALASHCKTLREPGGRLAANGARFIGTRVIDVVRGSRVVLHRVVVSTFEGIAKLDTRDLAWRVRARVGGTLVFFKGLLGEAVECQCGHGAFQTRSGHAPRAVRAAPAGKVVAFDPDQSFTHTSTSFTGALGLELGRRGWNTSVERARKDSCPSPRVILHGSSTRPSN